MKLFNFSVFAWIALSSISASQAASIQAQVFSAQETVTCKTDTLIITMKPRAPKIGESTVVYEQSGQTFIQAKVDVTVKDALTRKTIAQLVAQDVTDPWESAWPIYQGKDFSFYAQDPGKPTALDYFGKSLANVADCKF